MRSRGMLLLVLILMASGVVLSGCLNSDHHQFVRYNPDADEFVVLNLHRAIRGNASDVDYLARLWRERDRIYTIPTIAIFAKPALRRTLEGKFEWIDLSKETPATQPSMVETPVPLDSMRVAAGKLFVENDYLCYFDQVVIPGKLIDDLLPYATKEFAPDVIKQIDAEREARKSGRPTASWDELREAAQEGSANPLGTLDDETLTKWKAGLADGSIKIRRNRQAFTLEIPMSARDLKEAGATIEVLEQKLRKDDKGKEFMSLADLMQAIRLSTANGTLTLTADPCILTAAQKLEAIKLEAKELAESQTAVRAIKERGIPLDDKMAAEQVVKQFQDGTLPLR